MGSLVVSRVGSIINPGIDGSGIARPVVRAASIHVSAASCNSSMVWLSVSLAVAKQFCYYIPR